MAVTTIFCGRSSLSLRVRLEPSDLPWSCSDRSPKTFVITFFVCPSTKWEDSHTCSIGSGHTKCTKRDAYFLSAPTTEHSIIHRLEQLIDSIRRTRHMSNYAATVPICIDVEIPRTFTVQDARILLLSSCQWSFGASSSRDLEEKKEEKATRSSSRRRVETSKNRDDLKIYPWSVVPATVRPSALGERPSSSSSSSRSGGRTDTISRTPKIFPGFAIGSVPAVPAYYPLVPRPLTSCTGYSTDQSPEAEESG